MHAQSNIKASVEIKIIRKDGSQECSTHKADVGFKVEVQTDEEAAVEKQQPSSINM